MTGQCPRADELASYVRATLPDTDSERIAEHLETCRFCDETVSRLEREEHKALARVADSSQVSLPSAPISPVVAQRFLASLKCDDELGGCRLIQELGSGSFARVFLAQQTSMQRFIAVKVSARASNEPKLLSQLDHRHIVRVYHYDDQTLADRGLYLLYMQHVPGCSLKEVLNELSSIPLAHRTGDLLLSTIQRLMAEKSYANTIHRPEASALTGSDWTTAVCWIGARIADALQYAHKRGVLHRDIKPANILLMADGSPMLLDFNVGFGADVEGAQPDDDFGGSLAYMSPEQLAAFHRQESADTVTASSDIYSLAVVLFELVAGMRPRAAETLGATTTATLSSEPDEVGATTQYVQQLPRSCPRGLQHTLERGLASDPTSRPSSAAHVARQLQLDTNEGVRELLTIRHAGWDSWMSGHPFLARLSLLLVAGLVPNGLIAVLNYQFNSIYSNLNKELLATHHYYVNGVVFPLGVLILFMVCLPVLKAFVVERGDFDLTSDREHLSNRCLLMGAYFAKVVLTLWVLTGAIYPTLDAALLPGQLEIRDYVEFFVSQLLHGLIASSITFFLVTFVATRLLLPPLLHGEGTVETRKLLTRLTQLVERHRTILALTPSCALAALALFDDRERYLLLMLGSFGVFGYGVACLLTPSIRATLATLSILLSPTKQLLYGEKTETPGV